MRKDFLYIFVFIIILSFNLLPSCNKVFTPNREQGAIISDDLIDTESDSYQAGLAVTLMRAHQITDVQWTPLAEIPKTRPEGTFFIPGKTYKGIPYSSVKEMSKFVGQDVSIHTFLSAVSNPRSVLYTEVVNASPYHGKNCAPYYGIVCSMSVNYALGIEAPIRSSFYSLAPFMQKVTEYDVDMVKPGDVLASSGHTIMAVDVRRDWAGKVESIHFLENSYYIDFSREELQEYWNAGGFVLYRYKNMAQNTVVPEIEGVIPNPSLCPNRGDKSVYRSDETVVVTVLDGSYDSLVLFSNGKQISNITLDGEDIVLQDLQEGLYSAFLSAEGKQSETTYFEIRSAHIEVKNDNNSLTVVFDKHGIPAVTVELCEISGQHLYTRLLSQEEQSTGRIQIEAIDKYIPCYCKVIFQGSYGKIPSSYVSIN